MNFWKTSFWALIATAAKLLSQFIVAKIIAVFASVATFGIFGQFLSFVNIVQLGSGGVVNGGVTKYVSEYHKNQLQLIKLIETAIKFAIYASLITGLLIVIFCMPLSYYIFQTYKYWWVIGAFGLTLFGYTLNQMFLSIFNGLNKMSIYAAITIFSALLSVIFIGILTYFYHAEGALLGFVLSQLCMFFVGCLYLNKLPVKIHFFKSKLDKIELKKLIAFSLMAITSAIALPLAQMFLRGYVAYFSSWDEVGYWQAILRVSDAYLLIITMMISTYALPKYARISDNLELKREVFSVLIKLVPIAIIFALVIYVLREHVILILFSQDFLAMENLFLFQLIGDVLKVASWVIASVLLAKAQIKVYIKLEILFTIIYIVLSVIAFNLYGAVGLTMAFAINYTVYFIVVLFWFLRFVKK
ncbi:O-antigen translocase [Cysteiniphilum sp. 6C5]|uniref:O-antigen translocase n=1 Tax=unclassified Cysteiniphilum TaxID=2610889 RepID=UPI003F87A60D